MSPCCLETPPREASSPPCNRLEAVTGSQAISPVSMGPRWELGTELCFLRTWEPLSGWSPHPPPARPAQSQEGHRPQAPPGLASLLLLHPQPSSYLLPLHGPFWLHVLSKILWDSPLCPLSPEPFSPSNLHRLFTQPHYFMPPTLPVLYLFLSRPSLRRIYRKLL